MAAPTGKGYSRRTFLTALGVGLGAAGAAGVATGVSLGRIDLRNREIVSGNFTRLFPDLPPFLEKLEPAGATDPLRDVMRDLGKQGSLLDAKDHLEAGPVALIADAKVNGNDPPTNPDNTTQGAGVTFLGQFMDLDITFDSRSTLGVPTEPNATPNAHLAAFDPDTVYRIGTALSAQYH